MNKRRSLTPSSGMPAVPNGRLVRRTGVRRTVSDRVTFRSDAGHVREGWALNVSAGGVRAILDDEALETSKVELGEEFVITIGPLDATPPPVARRGRIVWLQEEPDGFVVGIEYQSLSGLHPVAAPAEGADGTGTASAVDASGVSPSLGEGAGSASRDDSPASQD